MVALRILVLLATALATMPSAAHLFELPGKARLPAETYFAVQDIYAGWALFAVPIFAALIGNALLAILERRRDRFAARAATAAAVLIAAGLVVFFLMVQPANAATSNWTVAPPDLAPLRRIWELGHAAIAVLQALALVATTAAVVEKHSIRDSR